MRVYKLLPATHGLSDITKSRIKVTRYSDLNDPFELLAGEGSQKLLRRAAAYMKKEFDGTKGIISFSKSWSNPVLWSHYADKHQGVALGFEIPEESGIEIRYSPVRIPVEYVGDDPGKGVRHTFVDETIRTKYQHWSYEGEVRMVEALEECMKEEGLHFKKFSDDLVLREVILGHSCRASIAEVAKLLAHEHPQAFVIEGRLAFNSFNVVPNQRSVRASPHPEVEQRYGRLQNKRG